MSDFEPYDPADIPPRHREGQRIYRVSVGVAWQDGKPVLVPEAVEVPR